MSSFEFARRHRQGAARALERVVLALETSGPGGAEAMVLQLAEGLRKRGLSVTLATMQPGWMTERAEQAGFPVWTDAMRQGPDPFWVLRFSRRLRGERIDLVHTHEFEMNAYGGAAAILARIPTLATLHGSVAGTEAKHFLGYRALGRLGQQMVAVSHDLVETLSGQLGGLRHSIRVIHNGTEVPAVVSDAEREEHRAASRGELEIPPDGALFVAIGNLYPVKDHATLLRAAAQIPGARVAIAGRGEEEAPLRRLALELGVAERVHLLGLRNDVPRILGAADVFVQPSLSEGLPLAVLEAMATQTPIVATRVGGVAEAVVDGETGILVPPGSPEDLAGVLRSLVEHRERAHTLARSGWKRAHDEFSTDTMTDRYLEVYREMSGQTAGPGRGAQR